MSRYLLHHHHRPQECGVVFAAFKGRQSPLRRQPALSSCAFGGHSIWWVVEAAGDAEALAQLPFYVAERATATRVSHVGIP